MRAEVVQIRCDRCKRTELRAPSEAAPKTEPDFKAVFKGKILVYEDVCSRCEEALLNVWKELEEWDRPINQPFGPIAKVEPNVAVPLVPAPDYTPPKPHSQIAAKK